MTRKKKICIIIVIIVIVLLLVKVIINIPKFNKIQNIDGGIVYNGISYRYSSQIVKTNSNKKLISLSFKRAYYASTMDNPEVIYLMGLHGGFYREDCFYKKTVYKDIIYSFDGETGIIHNYNLEDLLGEKVELDISSDNPDNYILLKKYEEHYIIELKIELIHQDKYYIKWNNDVYLASRLLLVKLGVDPENI